MDFWLTDSLMMETSQDIVSCYPVNSNVAGSHLMKEFRFGPSGFWILGTHDFRYDFTLFFIYMNSYMNS